MKKIVMVILILFVGFVSSGCNLNQSNDVVRIHIRANSNDVCDQNVKLLVRDSVVSYITPLISTASDSNDVKNILSNNIVEIENVADEVLVRNGFSYTASARIANEYFPSRDYNGTTFSADYYDALIINLGTGRGDNWWCVAYPPLCFVGEDVGSGNVTYRSKLVELINKYFKG